MEHVHVHHMLAQAASIGWFKKEGLTVSGRARL